MHKNKPANSLARREEQRLIARIQARETGWQRLFGQLIEEHIQAVYGRCLAYLKNADDAADATQEALFRAFQAIDRFRGDASLRTWLFSIADNECHTLVRKRARYQLEPDLEPSQEAPQTLFAVSAQCSEDDSELVRWALNRIRPGNRDVLQLRYFADLSIHEIAATLGIGLSAAKMRLNRAQQQLLDVMKPAHMEEAA